jgi:hypothetical protein
VTLSTFASSMSRLQSRRARSTFRMLHSRRSHQLVSKQDAWKRNPTFLLSCLISLRLCLFDFELSYLLHVSGSSRLTILDSEECLEVSTSYLEIGWSQATHYLSIRNFSHFSDLVLEVFHKPQISSRVDLEVAQAKSLFLARWSLPKSLLTRSH